MSIHEHATIVGTALWPREEDTALFAGRLATALMNLPRAGHALITLRGQLGTGKTTLVRYLLRALGVEGRIKSPTYALVEPYECRLPRAHFPIWHMDFYRFKDPEEWEQAGLRDVFASVGLKLVEWPECADDRLPPPDLALHLHSQADAEGLSAPRQIELRALSATGRSLIEALT